MIVVPSIVCETVDLSDALIWALASAGVRPAAATPSTPPSTKPRAPRSTDRLPKASVDGATDLVERLTFLDATVDEWAQEMVARSPTALAIAKRSFNADTESLRGIGNLGFQALSLYYNTDESKEGVQAFMEKRAPDFRKHAK